MGQSTDAHLFYGYCWDDEVEFDTDMDEWAEAQLKASGQTDPWDSHPGGHRPDWVAENREAIDAWYDAKKALTDALTVDWGSHCSGECPFPYLFVRGTETTANRGYPKPVFPYQMAEPGIGWKAQLDAFLESQGIDPPEGENQPGWWMASNWG